MKLSLQWISDFVDISFLEDPASFVQKISLSVCEVESFEIIGKALSSIIVAEVLKISPHPN